MPERVQRRRAKGWRMPDGAVYVGRGSKFGNPYRIIHSRGLTSPDRWTVDIGLDMPFLIDTTSRRAAHQVAVDEYRRMVGRNHSIPVLARAVLGGRDLCCWCPLDLPCHADVLLEVANPEEVL